MLKLGEASHATENTVLNWDLYTAWFIVIGCVSLFVLKIFDIIYWHFAMSWVNNKQQGLEDNTLIEKTDSRRNIVTGGSVEK